MKFIYIFITLISIKSYCQDTLRYEDISSNKYKKLKNYSEFKYYIDKNGHLFKKGDKLKILNPENPNNITQDLLGAKHYGNFTYLLQTKGLIFTVEKTFSNEIIELDNIYILNIPMLKKIPIEVHFDCKLNRSIDGIKSIQVVNIDKAIELKEVEIEGTITKEKALEILKKQKELLDLQIITQKQYDLKKEELSKILLENNI